MNGPIDETGGRAGQAIPLICTIGYQDASQAQVLAALRDASVDVLVDVRAVAASRRAGFSKRVLAASVAAVGIEYLHLRGLGTPAEGRAAARSGNHAKMERIFSAHLAGNEAQHDLEALIGLVRSGHRPCLLCFEHRPEHCHRRLVAEAAQKRVDAQLEHLLPVS